MAIVVREPYKLSGCARPTPRAVLFDLDDTLVDRSATLRLFASRLAADFGGRLLTRDVGELHPLVQQADRGGYRTRDELAHGLVAKLPWRSAPSPERLALYWAETFGACSTPSPGAIELVAALHARGVRTGIVTNGPPSQHVKIDALGIRSHLDAVLVSQEVGSAKPDPTIFRLALGLIDVPPSDAWFVGDHPVNDVLGAHSAGMTAVWLRRRLEWPDEHPRIGTPIDHLDELRLLLAGERSGR